MEAEYEATKQRKQLTVPEAITYVEAAASPSAERTADMLNSLGTALKNGPRPSRGDEQRVVNAISKLTGLLLEGSSSSSSSSNSMSRIEQLDGRYLSQSAWALSQVKSVRGTEVMQLGLAIAEQALRGEAMKAEGWKNWSGVLFGLAKAGISCSGSKQVQALFEVAVIHQLPPRLASGQACNAQDVSNLMLACSKAGFAGDLRPLMSAIASPAGVHVLNAERARPQAASNMVKAMSEMRCYDAAAYSTANGALLRKFDECNGFDLSNILFACAEARHWDSSMEGLAEQIDEEVVQNWNAQDLANSLYAWAVLTAAGPPAASASPSFKVMAQQLFSQVSKSSRLSAFVVMQFRQLYVAHQVAVYGKLPGGGLSGNAKLLETAAFVNEAYMNELQRRMKGNKIDSQVATALQRAGYEFKMAKVVERNGMEEVAPLLAQGVAVSIMSVDDYFRSPPDLLRGSKHIHVVLADWVCGGSIVIPEAEWAGLKSDPLQQQAYLARRMQKALKS
jgi:hypothetical protein